MDFESFRRHARACWNRVPLAYREGIQALVIERDAKRHPRLSGTFTLGECRRVPAPLVETSADLLSTVHLFHGSFEALREQDPGFDIEEEIAETIHHEIRHHLEDRAGWQHLEVEDWVEEQNDFRREGHPFEPGFHRRGRPLGEDVWEVSGDRFLEVALGRREIERHRGAPLAVVFENRLYEVALPADLSRPRHVVAGQDEEGEIVVVLRRKGSG